MPLFDVTIAPADPMAQRQAATAAKIRTLLNQQLSHLRRAYAEAFSLVWRNPDRLTPQQVVDALGTDAATLFGTAAAVQKLINDVLSLQGSPPVEFDKAPAEATVNPDGTVTVGDVKPEGV